MPGVAAGCRRLPDARRRRERRVVRRRCRADRGRRGRHRRSDEELLLLVGGTPALLCARPRVGRRLRRHGLGFPRPQILRRRTATRAARGGLACRLCLRRRASTRSGPDRRPRPSGCARGRRGRIGGRDGVGGDAVGALRVRRLAAGSRGSGARKEVQRIEVALRVRRRAEPEVDVRLREVGVAGRTGGSHDDTLVHRGPAPDAERAELQQRHRRAGRRPDRERLPAARNRPRERHDAGGRRPHVLSEGRADVDAAVLSGCIRVVAIEGKAAEDRAVDRPRPRTRSSDRKRERAEDQHADSPHGVPPCCQ